MVSGRILKPGEDTPSMRYEDRLLGFPFLLNCVRAAKVSAIDMVCLVLVWWRKGLCPTSDVSEGIIGSTLCACGSKGVYSSYKMYTQGWMKNKGKRLDLNAIKYWIQEFLDDRGAAEIDSETLRTICKKRLLGRYFQQYRFLCTVIFSRIPIYRLLILSSSSAISCVKNNDCLAVAPFPHLPASPLSYSISKQTLCLQAIARSTLIIRECARLHCE